MAGGKLEIDGLGKHYGRVGAVREVTLAAGPGEFVTLLGPSGSGKTTTLRIIAGFIAPDGGRVMLDGEDITYLPPHRRNIGMVFQNYALFPHLSAAQNVAFPLEMRRLPRAVIREQTQQALALVHLAGFEERRPRQLSGGQQQRVALARALVFRPRLLLMDEPLGALDRKLREAMQLEIVRISREVGVTILYVTHDQEEALAMSDRIAVYHEGRIAQLATPEAIYRTPATLFVANFIGESTTFLGRLEWRSGEAFLVNQHLAIPLDRRSAESLAVGSDVALVIRPEAMTIGSRGDPRPDGRAVVTGVLQNQVYLGSTRKCLVGTQDGTVAAVRTTREEDSRLALAEGQPVEVAWRLEDGIVLRR